MVWENGLWRGSVAAPGGEWLIGNTLHDGQPGYVAKKDPRGLMVKYWTARPEEGKYTGTSEGGGHEPPRPAHEGRREGVQVLNRRFYCWARDTEHLLSADQLETSFIELTATEPRRWYLGDSPFASGITVCRFFDREPEYFAQGNGFTVRVLDSGEYRDADWTDVISPTEKISSKRHSLLMVFAGSLHCAGNEELTLHASSFDYTYMQPTTRRSWLQGRGRTTAVVVRY